MTIISCENCICVPICMNKKWTHILQDCQHIRNYLAEEGRNLKVDETMVVGVPELKKRFMVFRNIKNELHLGFLQSSHIEQWGVAYGGSKSIGRS